MNRFNDNSQDVVSSLVGNDAATPVVEAQSLVLKYPRAAVASINGLSIRLTNGIHAVVGRNGAGKSTLFNAIVALSGIHSGHLRVLGVNLPSTELARRKLMTQIGYLPQDFGYIPNFTVREFVEYAAWLKKVPSAEVTNAVSEAIATVDLSDRSDTKLSKLSGGMRRRAGIATAIVHNPSLVVLDEPTAGLDPEQRIRFRETLRQVAVNRCVLISSHLIEDVQAVADHVMVLDAGELLFAGTVAEMKAHASTTSEGDSVMERAYTALVTRARKGEGSPS